jgi:anthranilate phosphoribosyltransferase
MTVCGELQDDTGTTRYLDELSPLGPNSIAEFYQPRALAFSTLLPESFPVQPATLEDLRGGDKAHNAALVRNICSGKDRGPRRDAVLLNASAALFVAGAVRTMSDGWDRAGELIDSGAAMTKIESLRRT